MSRRIGEYALIGDMRSAALIDGSGSLDWWSTPRFDSASPFARLLDEERAGFWRVAPRLPARIRRRYSNDSLILETTFDVPGGTVRLTDCAPLNSPQPAIVRVVDGMVGEVDMIMRLCPRMHYGQLTPWTRTIDERWEAILAPDALVLRSSVPVRDRNGDAVAHFVVRAGERVEFVLQWHHPATPVPAPLDAGRALETTAASWQRWADRIAYRGHRHDAVVRSALTLKALTYRETGAILAAATTSLPERLGGDWNWDYRYCWLRDAAFAMASLIELGCDAEVAAWCDWFLNVYAGQAESLHIMYGLGGERLSPEAKLPWLRGFADSSPVRVGNAAHGQFQLGVIGDVTRTLVAAAQRGVWSIDSERWRLLRRLIPYLESAWQRPDHGIWETRGQTHRYTHSILMAWRAAADLALLAPAAGPDAARATALAERIRADLEPRTDRDGAYTEYVGSSELDASLLLMPLYDFLPIDDPRIRATVARIEQALVVDGYVFRYSPDITTRNGRLEEREGSFTMCGFWLVQVMVRQERLDEARRLFERLLATANDLGLLTEEYDVTSHQAVGNIPQAFSHTGLIAAAVALDRAAVPAEARA